MHPFLVYYCLINIFPGTLTAYVKLSESLLNSAISCSQLVDKPNKRVSGDPDKTLFVGKLSKDTCESKITTQTLSI